MAVTNGSAPPIGIDLGTTHSCVAYLDIDGKPIVIKAKDGNHTTPSHVAFLRSGRAVGSTAKTDPERSDDNTIYDAKRLLGRSFNAPEIQDDLQKWPFTVVADSNGLPKYRVRERGQEVFYAPEQISAFVLEELREAAQLHFGPDKLVADAVITVPAYFTDGQKQATVTAARLAKLNVLQLINEPTAAALAFGLRHPPGHDTRNVLVFDLGGGTFDTVLLQRTKDVIRVKNVGGDSHLGGQDFDWELMKVALRTWDSRHPHIQIQPGTKAWRRLRLACELAKKELSKPDVEGTWIELVDLAQQQDFDMEIDKDEFEFHVSWLIDRCMEAVTGLLQEAHIAAADVHDVVVVGGASRMTGLRDRLELMFPAHFQTSLHMTDATINADEAVAIGAAITAANHVPDPNVDRNGEPKIGRPDDVPNPTPPGGTVINATAMTLGIQHGEMKQLFPLIPKGTPLPAEGRQKFTNLRAYQPSILFQVFEGEKPFACENEMLGMFQLPNIRQGPAGSANIMVTLHVGEDGILHATAYDEDTGDAQQLKVTHLSRLDANSINQLQQGSEYYNYSTDDTKSPNGSDLPTHRLNVDAASGFAKFDSRNTGF